MFGKIFQRSNSPDATKAVLAELVKLIEAKNIPVIMDDIDAGYDMAIDEVLDIIHDTMKRIPSNP